jgi:hypothetical protein
MSTIETKKDEVSEHKYSFCRSWSSRRNSRRTGFGVLLLTIGLVWLGAKTGYIPMEWFHSGFFWPAVFILLGSWMVVKSVIRRKHQRECC